MPSAILAAMKRNNEQYNEKLRAERIRKATRLLRRHKSGTSIATLAAELNVTTARVYKLIASVK